MKELSLSKLLAILRRAENLLVLCLRLVALVVEVARIRLGDFRPWAFLLLASFRRLRPWNLQTFVEALAAEHIVDCMLDMLVVADQTAVALEAAALVAALAQPKTPALIVLAEVSEVVEASAFDRHFVDRLVRFVPDFVGSDRP